MRFAPLSAAVALSLMPAAAAADDACITVPVIGRRGPPPHLLCGPEPGTPPRGQLVLFFVGSGGKPPAPNAPFVQHARSLGFHFFGLSYPDAPSVGSFCESSGRQLADPDCDYRIRKIRLYGGRFNASAPCTAKDGCVEPASLGGVAQFSAVVQAAAKRGGGWASFTDADGIAWGKVVAAGHSQGAGMALLVGQLHPLAGVVQLAGVDDIDINGADPSSTPAPWVLRNRSGATPIERVWGLGNVWGFCCAYWHANWPAIGMLGPLVSVDDGVAGLGGSHQLCSSVNASGISGHGMPLQFPGYGDAWTLMLTGKPPPGTAGTTRKASAADCSCPGARGRAGLKSDDESHTRTTVVSVADHGAIADSEADSCLAFEKSIDAARANNASVLRIPRGTYHFSWDVCTRADIYVSNTVVTPLPPKPIALWLRGLTGLVIEGEHSLLLMHGLMTPIAIDHSHNVTVKNLAIDFPHPSVIEALVTTVAADSMSLELQVHSSNNVSVSKGKAVFGSFGEGWTLAQPAPLAQEFDPASDITWRRSNPMYGATVTALDDAQSLRLTYKTKQSQMPKAGHHLWFRDGARPNAGLITQYSSSVTYDSVIMHFMSGFGVVAQYTTGLSLLNVSAETAAGSGRYCSCQADLLHFSGCAGLINVTGGRFVGSQDDGVNTHGTHLQIVEQPSERNIVVQFMQHESYGFQAFFAGDTVQFTRSDSLESFGTGVIKSAKMLSTKGCPADPNSVLPCQQALELEHPLVGARLKMDVVENLAYTADLSITGAYFSRIPTRGMLVSTRGRVRISNNTIHTPLRPALHIADDAQSWFESGPVADVVFDGNRVIRKHSTSASHARVDSTPVDVAPSNTKNATVHRNLRVTNNELHLHLGSQLGVVAAKSIAGVTLSGNRIYSPGRPLAPREMVSSVNCSGVVIDHNNVITSTTTPPVKRDDVAATTTSRVIHAGGVVTAGVRALKSDEGSRGGKRVLWWVNSGNGTAAGPTNAEFVARHRKAMTGLVPGFGCWGISTPKNGTGIALSVDELCGPKYFSAKAHSAMAGLDIFPVGRPDVQAVLGDYGPAVAALARHAKLSNWSGIHSDLEADLGNVSVMTAYAQFMSNLSVAFERQGMEVYVDGHTYIKLMAQTHEKSLPGAPRVMTMGSYWNQLTWNQSGPLNVSLRLNEYAQALDPDRCDRATYGIGLMLDKKAELNASTNYRWTQPYLRQMLELIDSTGLCEVAVYTNPMDQQGRDLGPISAGWHPSWSRHAAPWFVAELERFLRPKPGPEARSVRGHGEGVAASRGARVND